MSIVAAICALIAILLLAQRVTKLRLLLLAFALVLNAVFHAKS